MKKKVTNSHTSTPSPLTLTPSPDARAVYFHDCTSSVDGPCHLVPSSCVLVMGPWLDVVVPALGNARINLSSSPASLASLDPPTTSRALILRLFPRLDCQLGSSAIVWLCRACKLEIDYKDLHPPERFLSAVCRRE